jgi:hypothetical protein
MNNYEDQYEKETRYYASDDRGFYTPSFAKWLTIKLTSETARADKAEAERDEYKDMLHVYQRKLGEFSTEANKYKAERDELIGYCEGIISFHKKYEDLCFSETGQFAVKWLNLMTAAIKKIKGE